KKNIYTKLNGIPIIAVALNLSSDCKYPVITPIIPLNKIIGEPTLVKLTAKSNCWSLNPLASILTINGAPKTVTNTIIIDIHNMILITLFVCDILPFFPSFTSISDNIGIDVVAIVLLIKAVAIPVADIAIKYVSVSIPDPNLTAINVSRKNPNNLLPKV